MHKLLFLPPEKKNKKQLITLIRFFASANFCSEVYSSTFFFSYNGYFYSSSSSTFDLSSSFYSYVSSIPEVKSVPGPTFIT